MGQLVTQNKAEPEISVQEKAVNSRRQLLKVLAATGGAVTTSALLSGNWIKPIVEVGLLPAHAQVSAYAIQADTTTEPGSGPACWVEGIVATVSPPIAGAELRMTPQKLSGPDSVPGPSTATTDGSGVANFGDLYTEFDATFNLVFSFVDQAQYGPATTSRGSFTGSTAC
ncbi:MAG: twin-arginine translocation signal domain-containing protein [Anaerolineae bacterium]|nr:twin-arginine translocation signal domain-containing protein [Anaerolineae bacterium]